MKLIDELRQQERIVAALKNNPAAAFNFIEDSFKKAIQSKPQPKQMPTARLSVQFKDVANEPKENGMKFVIFKVSQPGFDVIYDYGFCDFGIDGWDKMDNVEVVKWVDLPSAAELIIG